MSNTTNEHDADALAEALARDVFQIGMPSFNSYLETISEFLKAETKKHLEDIDDFKGQIKSGKIVLDDEPGQLTYEDHLNDLLRDTDEFENILLKSAFMAIYSFLEAKLIQYCREFEKDNIHVVLPLSSIRDDKGIEKAKKYYRRNMNFSFGQYKEWPRIKIYGIIRNCIAHNEGRFDDGFIIKESLRKELKKFITQKNSNLSLDGHDIVLTKEFCEETWETIEEFLWLVSHAETRAKE
jgi:hypothetical protein